MRTLNALLVSALALFDAFSRCWTATVSDQSDKLWCSSGGGFISMSADVGYANMFHSLSLFPGGIPGTTSKFSAVSSNSGGTWFMLQFFYSPQFHAKVTESNTEQLKDFMLQALQSYQKNGLPQNISPVSRCEALREYAELLPLMGEFVDFCNLANAFKYNWADYIETIFTSMAIGYGGDGEAFVTVEATGANKIPVLRDLPLSIQTSLAANARSNIVDEAKNSTKITYLGPSTGSEGSVWTQPMPVQWFAASGVDESAEDVWKPEGFLDELVTYVEGADPDFSATSFKQFGLFPPTEQTNDITVLDVGEKIVAMGPFQPVFGGHPPTTAQIGAASSADAFSGGVPSAFAQFYTKLFSQIDDSDIIFPLKKVAKAKFNEAAQYFWASAETDDFSICSEWTSENYHGCPPESGRFMDGGYADDTTLAQTIASHQEALDFSAESDHTLKIIFTYNDDFSGTNSALKYLFSTPENSMVPPGQYFWANSDKIPHPQRQVFATYMTDEDISGLYEGVPGTNMSTAIINTTTVDNPVFGTKAGLAVSILVLKINPTGLPMLLLKNPAGSVALADLTEHIASNGVLKERVTKFLQDDKWDGTTVSEVPPTTEVADTSSVPTSGGSLADAKLAFFGMIIGVLLVHKWLLSL